MYVAPLITRKVREWTISAGQIDASEWQVEAHNGLIFSERSRGIDCETALCSISEKTGLMQHEVLEAFGLDTLNP